MKTYLAIAGVVAVLLAARLCTGIVYEFGEDTSYLVVKRMPAFWSVRDATASDPASRDIAIDSDELQLAYEGIYLHAMRAVPVLVPLMVAAGVGVAVRRRRA